MFDTVLNVRLLNVDNRNTIVRCEIYSKLTIKGAVLVSLLITLNIFTHCSRVVTSWDVLFLFNMFSNLK